MGLIWFGVKKANIGIDEFTVRCPACEADNYADIMIASNYFHIYFPSPWFVSPRTIRSAAVGVPLRSSPPSGLPTNGRYKTKNIL